MSAPAVTRTIVCDGLTPVRAYAALRKAAPESASFLLESVVGAERWGRYSVLGYRPRWEATLHRDGWQLEPPELAARLGATGDPIARIAPLLSDDAPEARPHESTAERFAGAHVGYFAWDIVHLIEKVPPGESDTWDTHYVPISRLLGGATVVVFDGLAQTVTVAGPTEADVERAIADMQSDVTLRDIRVPDRSDVPRQVRTDLDDAAFKERVARAQEYIAAGDAFQIVVARTFTVPREGRDPFDVYRAMRVLNPSPYMYYLDFPAKEGVPPLQIAGASPETMVRLDAGTMTVRPLAGTRKRGATEEEDAKLARELLADPKEVAEHVMLIDLGRNDVGRVAEVGSVELVRKMEIERYSHVMHIVSEVRGRVPPTLPPLEVVRAAFPAGTLSGAPKIRAMQIIRELEARPRGIYGGAIGYVTAGGELDFAIAIRTLICKGENFEVTAGAGIVEASDPQSEADETRSKARGVLCAIEAAG